MYSPRQDVVVPLGRRVEGNDGKRIRELLVEAGTMVIIGAAAVNQDPLIWGPTAEQWIPERWLDPLPRSVVDAHLPSVYANLYVNTPSTELRAEHCYSE